MKLKQIGSRNINNLATTSILCIRIAKEYSHFILGAGVGDVHLQLLPCQRIDTAEVSGETKLKRITKIISILLDNVVRENLDIFVSALQVLHILHQGD